MDTDLLSNELKNNIPVNSTTKSEVFEKNFEPLSDRTSLHPVHLSIPKINVDASIEEVGLTQEGAMDVPIGRTNAGWFSSGTKPGEIGSAVVDGHYGVWKNGTSGVFNNLHKLRTGDKISIRNRKGNTIVFIVRELRIYKKYDNASSVFVSTDGKAHLNLITCQGIWNKLQNTYPERLVVFADKE